MPGRKTITLELRGGKSQRQRIWDLIRWHHERNLEFTQKDVTPGDVPNATARDYLHCLVAGKYLKITQQGRHPRVCSKFRVINDAGVEAPRVRKDGKAVTQGSVNEAIWGAMQALGKFTAKVLANVAGVNEITVSRYATSLEHAGYLVIDRAGKGMGNGGIQTQYRLLRSKITGPRPPMITRLKAVYDPNIHKIVWQEGADKAVEEL